VVPMTSDIEAARHSALRFTDDFLFIFQSDVFLLTNS